MSTDTPGADIERRRTAQLQHGLRSDFAETKDERALTEPQRGRLAEIRAELATPAGVIDALVDHAAKTSLIFEWGISWLQHEAETHGARAAFSAPMMARFFTAAAERRRALETLVKLQGKGGGPDAGDVLDAIRRAKRDQDGE